MLPAAMMGTPGNRALMQDAGLLTTAAEAAGPIDLVIAVVADDEATARQAKEAVRAALSGRATASGGSSEMPRPRTLASALRAAPDANIALISIPGLYAAAEARRALRAGLHVMLFSDNVPVTTEIELKRFALARGLLMLGPDCGTRWNLLRGVRHESLAFEQCDLERERFANGLHVLQQTVDFEARVS